jgi:hypothetical protein
MKRTAIALLLASLIVATQAAAAESAFPQGADGEPRGEPALSTYADGHANDPVRIVGSPFPAGADGEYAYFHVQDSLRFSESPQTVGTNVR